MFTKFTSIQPVADRLKPLIGPRSRTTRRVYELMTRFERAPWYPAAFDEALRQGPIQIANGQLVAEGDPAEAVGRVIEYYLNTPGMPTDPDEKLTLRQAAGLIGCDVTPLKRAVQSGKLPAEHIDTPGNGYYVVRRADAEAWGATFHAARDHRPGRKPKPVTR
jgi:hypothetical protein